MSNILIGGKLVGEGHPVYITAEIGLNHNGDIDKALQLIRLAKSAGCDAVKFQKRTPEICVPRTQWDQLRSTPWGEMTYIEYRHRMEFGSNEFDQIAENCRAINIDWFASAWDVEALKFLQRYDVPAHKVASACLTDNELLAALSAQEKPVILSTGMSSQQEIHFAVKSLGLVPLVVCHATSAYPCSDLEVNVRMISTLRTDFPNKVIGYSGHERDFLPTCLAVAQGACFVERHITDDKRQWGSDHSSSMDPGELTELVAMIRRAETCLGDGIKRVYESELPHLMKLRRVRGEGFQS